MSETKDQKSLVNQSSSDDDIPFSATEQIAMGRVPPKEVPPLRAKDVLNPKQESHQATIGRHTSFRREIFLAVMQGFASRGELSRRQPGSTLGVTTDADVQGICRHAAGVASFAYEAAKAASI